MISNNSDYFIWARDTLRIQIDPRLVVHTVSSIELDQTSNSSSSQIERGIKTLEDIPPKSTLAIAPFESLLTIESAKEIPLFSTILGLELREDDMLSLILLYEKSQGRRSKWFPHLSLLPTQYHSIINYNDDQLSIIKGTNLYSIASRWKLQIKEDFEELIQKLNSKSWDHGNNLGEVFSFERYIWALSTIWSRFITLDCSSGQMRAMVPLVDFLNHDPNSTVGHAFNVADNQLYLYTSGALPSNREVFLSYGDNSNARLLMLYGFALFDNPSASVDVWATMDSRTLDFSKKMDILGSLDIYCNEKPFIVYSGKVPEDLLVFLRVQHLSEEELSDLYQSQLRTAARSPITVENESKAIRALQDALSNLLEAYPTSLSEDEDRIRTLMSREQEQADDFQHPAFRELHSYMLVRSEKVVLHSVLDILAISLKRILDEGISSR